MNEKLKGVLITGAVIAALACGGAAIAEQPGPATTSPAPTTATAARSPARRSTVRARSRSRRSAAARVTESEVDDEEGYYEIGVTRDDGSQVDVHLDRDFNVLDSSSDGGSDDD